MGLNLSPQQILSLHVLQEPALELQQRIEAELVQNPVLEITGNSHEISAGDLMGEAQYPSTSMDSAARMVEKDESLTDQVREDWEDGVLPDMADGQRFDSDSEERRRHFFDSLSTEPSFLDSLHEQLMDVIPPEREDLAQATETVLGNLDDTGYLKASDAEIAAGANVPLEVAQEAVKCVQHLDPPGLAARDLRECLLLQLERSREKGSLAWDIVDRHLDELARNHIPRIAKELDAEVAEIQEAVERIRRLEPRPGRLLSPKTAAIVEPDLIFEKDPQGEWTVRLNRELIPRLGISTMYTDMLKSTDMSSDDRKYLKQQIASGNTFINAISVRMSTLEKLGHEIIEYQSDFLEAGPEALHPLTMRQVAEDLELHETTISRAVAGKYARTPHGLVALRDFFAAGYQSAMGDDVSSRAVIAKITAIVNGEPSDKPYSDQKIVELLAKEGLNIARRTVAKYREEAGIPAASLRKIHS